MPCNTTKFVFAMRKLALRAIATRSFFFPATAKFCLVQTKLPVVGTWSTTLGAIGPCASRANGVGDFSIGKGRARSRSVRASVLGLDATSHHLRRNFLPTIILVRVERGGRIHSRSELHVAVHQGKGGSIAKGRWIRRRMMVGTTENPMLLLNTVHCRVMVLGNSTGKHHIVDLLGTA